MIVLYLQILTHKIILFSSIYAFFIFFSFTLHVIKLKIVTIQ